MNQPSAAMDHRLWRRLPEDCLDRIIARLPLPSIFRLRSVSKRWNSFIFSEAFLALQSEVTCRCPCFLLCTQGRVACIYSFSLDRWHFVPLPKVRLTITTPPVSVVCAAGSFLLYGNQVSECSVLFVCNPFTRQMRELPAMSRVRLIHKATLIPDPIDRSYKIMVAGEDFLHLTSPHVYKLFTEVYDSASDCWKMAQDPLPDAKFGSDPGVWFGGSFFSITELPYGVVAFDLRSSSWRELKAAMPACLGSPSLVECKGRLMMVGRICHVKAETGPKTESIRIWELQNAQTEWVELHRMPANLCYEFVELLSPHSPFICVGMDNLICLTTHLSPRMLVFDASTHCWRWLPRDPLFPKHRNFHLLGFSFEPKLDAQP
ncbi:hypothetical protein O6H91_01G168100 [Diphasiastrum complanatum]|uniref:Uncharacterized protein n=1 Tax=Diphasiastrum complanatum TaxID=34168 RepID=A0ACC2EYT8_DIPCM|nr:hypothetical protein O6H91_01G168100 [Diphasiastrum complanatum]